MEIQPNLQKFFQERKQMLERLCTQGRQCQPCDEVLTRLWPHVNMKMCYNNTATLVLVLRGQGIDANYVLGYAINMDLGLPIEHAWLEIEGVYYDPTWEKYTDLGDHYLAEKTFSGDELIEFLERNDSHPPEFYSKDA